MRADPYLLRVAAAVEVVSLAVLLLNLATVHAAAVSSLVGPLHGCAYLWVVGAAVATAGVRSATTALALLPAVGGVLAARRLGRGFADREDVGGRGDGHDRQDVDGR